MVWLLVAKKLADLEARRDIDVAIAFIEPDIAARRILGIGAHAKAVETPITVDPVRGLQHE